MGEIKAKLTLAHGDEWVRYARRNSAIRDFMLSPPPPAFRL
jgi:hypothetical protein